MASLDYKAPGPVVKTFMKDDSFFRGLRGPVGSGKSVSCCIEILRRALAQEPNAEGIRKSRWAVVRNTNPHKTRTYEFIVLIVSSASGSASLQGQNS